MSSLLLAVLKRLTTSDRKYYSHFINQEPEAQGHEEKKKCAQIHTTKCQWTQELQLEHPHSKISEAPWKCYQEVWSFRVSWQIVGLNSQIIQIYAYSSSVTHLALHLCQLDRTHDQYKPPYCTDGDVYWGTVNGCEICGLSRSNKGQRAWIWACPPQRTSILIPGGGGWRQTQFLLILQRPFKRLTL